MSATNLDKMGDLNSPTEQVLISPVVEQMERVNDNEDKIKMKKQLGLLEGVAIILGIIFGSGIDIILKKGFGHNFNSN